MCARQSELLSPSGRSVVRSVISHEHQDHLDVEFPTCRLEGSRSCFLRLAVRCRCLVSLTTHAKIPVLAPELMPDSNRILVEAEGRKFSVRRYSPHQGGDLSCHCTNAASIQAVCLKAAANESLPSCPSEADAALSGNEPHKQLNFR